MALAQMIVVRPTIVIGFGGYPSIPALTAATILRIPRMVHEQNGVLGRVNQLFAPVMNAVACGTWPTEMSDKITGHHVGNPVRAAIAERAGAGYIPPGDYPMSILVLGGSQGARILSDVVPPAIVGPRHVASICLCRRVGDEHWYGDRPVCLYAHFARHDG